MAGVTAYSSLYASVQDELPGRVPTGTMIRACRKAVRRFCDKSEEMTKDLTAINLVAEQDEYLLTPPTDTIILRIRELRVNTTEGVTNGDEGELIHPSHYLLNPETGKVELDWEPAESVTSGLTVRVVLAPDLDGATAFTWFMDRWADGLVACAVAELAAMPRKPWSDRSTAERFHRRFLNELGKAKSERFRGHAERSSPLEG